MDGQNRDIRMAWHIAALAAAAFVGKMPKLETLLVRTGPKVSPRAQQVAMFHHISQTFGIPMRVKTA